MKFIVISLVLFSAIVVKVPEVKVSGAMKNVMMKGDLSAHADIDTMSKVNLYGLGPVAGLKGEIMVFDGKVYSTAKDGNKLLSQQDKVSQAAFLVYSNVEKWKAFSNNTTINSYAELEKLVETTAISNGYDMEVPFAFKVEAVPQKISYHVIDWKEGAAHTMGNHKQFAYTGEFINTGITILGFYSTHHQSIYTHHTTFMHVHFFDDKTKTVGHLDELSVKGPVIIYLPEK
jgi:acetolactate decarboxylase